MRNIIKNILKESQDFQSSVFLLMSEDGKFVKYNLHIAGDKYFSGGRNHDGWENIEYLNNKTFQEFYINQRKNAEGMLSIIPQTQLDTYKPKVVEYIMGFFKKEENVDNLFDKLNEENTSTNNDLIYTLEDLLSLADNNVKLYEIRPGGTIPFSISDNLENDSIGNLYHLKRQQPNSVMVCWKELNEESFEEKCYEGGRLAGELVSLFNDGRFIPTTIYNGDFDPFKNLYESEDDDLEWARDIVSNPFNGIKVGDVFYIVDPDSDNPRPDDYKPTNARYIFVVTNIKEGGKKASDYGISDDIFLVSKYCTPDDATYNSNDYYETSPKCRGFEEDNKAYSLTGINWAKHLMDLKYWRKMS